MTRSGVEWDLRKSPYATTISYRDDHAISFVFSSATVKARFDEAIEDNRSEIKDSLSNRFRIKFKIADDMCDLSLYRKLERRGFLIYVNGSVVEWLGNVEYNGRQVCLKS